MNKTRRERIGKMMVLMFLDIMIFFISYYFAFLLRYNFELPSGVFWNLGIYLGIAIYIKILVFVAADMYNTLWRYASIQELGRIIVAVFLGNVLASLMFFSLHMWIPGSVVVLNFMLDVILIGGSRISYRVVRRLNMRKRDAMNANIERTLVFGAGEAGVQILKDMLISPNAYKVVGFLDDDPTKQGKKINGYPIFGNRHLFKEIVESCQVNLIIIACPSANNKTIKEVAELAKNTGATVKILPVFSEILNYDVSLSRLRDLQIEDLLNRDEVVLDKNQISAFINNKVVMVTGGGGSIGSELCRQIIQYRPKNIIIVDIYENSLYYLELELERYLKKQAEDNPMDTTIDLEIASVRDKARLKELFETYRPQVVFHAAAHKHVPLMEKTPKEAVKNNIMGTRNLLDACVAFDVEKFVQISTDKAVKPTNVMGTTKRVCEILVQTYNEVNGTDFVAVRFGNVLGSNGSVIPIFKEQIAQGGPITVTHKNIERFFMTIPEATQLVLQAGSIANGGEIFVLDMGEPVKILELAEKMILLSGFEPYTEMPIVFSGLRPGEKLYEELSYDLKAFDCSQHKDIFIEKLQHFEKPWIDDQLSILCNIIENGTDQDVINQLQVLVPDYVPTTNL